MEIKSKGFELLVSSEEAIALATLLANMSPKEMKSYGVTEKESDLLFEMYTVLSNFVPIHETE